MSHCHLTREAPRPVARCLLPSAPRGRWWAKFLKPFPESRDGGNRAPLRAKPKRRHGSLCHEEDCQGRTRPSNRGDLHPWRGSRDARSTSLAWQWAIGRHTEKAPNGRPSGSWPPLGEHWPLPVSSETQNCGRFQGSLNRLNTSGFCWRYLKRKIPSSRTCLIFPFIHGRIGLQSWILFMNS